MNKRRHLWISGRVQGVFFRANAAKMAHSLGLTGWVRNLADGRVETVFEGKSDAVEAMLSWCRNGTPPARVEHVDSADETPTGDFTGFEITRP